MFLPPMIQIVTSFLFVFINLARFSLTIYLRTLRCSSLEWTIIVSLFIFNYLFLSILIFGSEKVKKWS